MRPRDFQEILNRYSSGKCTPAEEKLIHDWYNNIGKDLSEESELDALGVLDYNKNTAEANIWSKIRPHQKPAGRSTSFTLLKIAATILLLAMVGSGAYYFFIKTGSAQHVIAIKAEENIDNTLFETFVNSEDQSQQIKLEDGSEVTLKPGSEISFARDFSNNREVHLTGEAFFNVKRNPLRPFLVYTNEVVTRVLGTSFNIKAYKNDKQITVAVKTGKVSVYTKENADPTTQDTPQSAVILTPNQQVVYNRNSEKVSKQVVEKPEIILPEPTLFKMVYDGAPVTKIFEVLEENYGIDIEYDEALLSGCVLTTNMSDEGLYERIEVICKAINADYTISDAVIIIKSRGCL